ncbi:MAG: hypothetical protein IJB65_03395 [Clostridia bacterium]|nr:hypothetical protein [Clostridia bacterium]
MYNREEGIREQIRAERKAVILFFVLMLALGAFVVLTAGKSEDDKIYYGIYAVAFFFIIKYTRVYCFFLPRRRYGTVVSMSDFEEKHSITNPGTYARRTGQYTKMDFTLELRFENGKTKYFEFEFTGALKDLKAGDSVGIYRFLKMPVRA